jgi:hypothetical protein
MIIANPIYDIVFKYLMEDMEIAKGLLAAILKEEIVSIEVKAQESSAEVVTHGVPLAIIRFDFKAVIRKKDGEHVKVLIELQKARHLLDIMRFRGYLGDNYSKEDTIIDEQGRNTTQALPIIAIYLLGFKINEAYPSVAHVKGIVEDVISGERLAERPKEPFVDLLTHESYIIQIRRLKNTFKTELERILSVFDQTYILESDTHKMDYVLKVSDPLVKRMVDRLNRAAASEQIRKQMNMEDEADRVVGGLLREQAEEHSKAMAQKNQIISEKEQVISEKEQVISEKEQVISEKDKRIAELLEQLKNKK